MRKSKLWTGVVLALGATFGYVAASGGPSWFNKASAASSEQIKSSQLCSNIGDIDTGSCCDGLGKSQMMMGNAAFAPVAITAMTPGNTKQDGEESITFEILVPADAVLELNGTKMDPTGESRRFVTPTLKTGGNYSYDVKVSSKGKEVTRKIQLRHGTSNTFDLRGDFGGSSSGSPSRVSAKPADGKKPNILFIMGDDIGWMQPSCYHRGIMVGETPNIDRLAREGAMFMHYYAESSCTAGRCSFITGMHPFRAGMVLPQLPGAISYLRPGTPCLAKFLHDLGYSTGEFGKNHLGDHPDSLPTAHGFQEFWGYLYHLDAMQQVSFPDINSSPTHQAVVPPMKMVPIPGIPETPGAIDPKDGVCMAAPRPILWMKSSDGTAKNQMGKDEGPLTLERSKTVDEEISSHVNDWLDRNDPKKTNKPFFCWYNPARMHVTTVLSKKYEDMIGTKGGKDWGANEAGMKQMDDNIGYVLKKLEDMGELDNTIVVFTTDNGAEVQTFPDGGVTPFKAGKLTTWEGGMRVPCVIRWPGVIKPGTIFKEMFSGLDWLPTFVEIAGGQKGNDLNKMIMEGKYEGIVKTKLDGTNQLSYLQGKTPSNRDTFFYYQGRLPSAVRYKNWKFYYTMMGSTGASALDAATTYHWTQLQNIMRDPFENNVGAEQKGAFSIAGALASPSTAYIYDWNLLPIGQLLWEKELMSYRDFPPLQLAASYNLEQILQQIKEMGSKHPSE